MPGFTHTSLLSQIVNQVSNAFCGHLRPFNFQTKQLVRGDDQGLWRNTYCWNQADFAPVPTLRLVTLNEIDDYLPAFTARVDSEKRAETLNRRRSAALRRFLR